MHSGGIAGGRASRVIGPAALATAAGSRVDRRRNRHLLCTWRGVHYCRELILRICALFAVTIVSLAVAITTRTNCRNLAVSTVAALAANSTSLSRMSNLVARK